MVEPTNGGVAIWSGRGVLRPLVRKEKRPEPLKCRKRKLASESLAALPRATRDQSTPAAMSLAAHSEIKETSLAPRSSLDLIATFLLLPGAVFRHLVALSYESSPPSYEAS